MNINTDLLNCFVESIDTQKKFQIMGVFCGQTTNYESVYFLLLNEKNEFVVSQATNFKYIIQPPETTVEVESRLSKKLLLEQLNKKLNEHSK